jgi:hypothetical protein
LFTSIWEGIKGVVMGFVEWLSPVIDMIIAPFKAIGNVIGGIIGTVKGWFGETVEIGKTELAGMNENKMRDAAARPVQTSTPAPAAQTAAASFTTTIAASAPSLAAPVPGMEIVSPTAAAPTLTAASAASAPSLAAPVTTTSSSGNSLAMEHFEAAQRKGVSPSDISYTAALAFENAGMYTPQATAVDRQQVSMTAASSPFLESLPAIPAAPSVDIPDIESEARVNFAEAMPSRRETVITNTEREDRADGTPRQNIFHIANMNFNADELRTLLDLVHQIELAVIEPEGMTV